MATRQPGGGIHLWLMKLFVWVKLLVRFKMTEVTYKGQGGDFGNDRDKGTCEVMESGPTSTMMLDRGPSSRVENGCNHTVGVENHQGGNIRMELMYLRGSF